MSEFSPELTRAIEDYELRVSPDLKTVAGRLKYGIGVIDGEMHHDFSMHLLTVREDMAIDHYVLRKTGIRLPPVFKIPQTRVNKTYVSDEFIARVNECKLTGFRFQPLP